MIDHDRLFKELLTTFFAEFVELFLPDVSEHLERGSIKFLDKEIFTDVTAGESREVDLLAQAKVRDEEAFILIHLEHQSSPQAEFGKRMFRYFARLHEGHDMPIYPVVLFSYDKPHRAEPDRYQVRLQDHLVLDFWYHVIQLNRLPWRDFVRQRNPMASALMAKMQMAPEDRVRVKLECLRLLTTLHLDPARERLISGFVGTYLELNAAEEEQQMAELQTLPSREKEGIMDIMTSWKREGIEEGLQKGLKKGLQKGLKKGRQEGQQKGLQKGVRSVTARLLSMRVGTLPLSIQERLNRLSVEQLELLSEATFDIASMEDVEVWLAKNG